MIPIDNETFNNLDWQAVDGMQVGSLLQGLQIIEAEPTDYPLTDSVIIYARNNDTGEIKVIDIGMDLITDEETEDSFYIRIATV